MLSIHRILVPIDFSEHAAEALACAREFAVVHSSNIDVVHVIEEPAFPAFYKMGEAALYGDVSKLSERAEDALTEFIERVPGPPLEKMPGLHVEEGKAVDRIVALSKKLDTDLLVISTHGLSGVARVLMGSVAEGVLRNAECPVFVVKAYGKSLLPGATGGPEGGESA